MKQLFLFLIIILNFSCNKEKENNKTKAGPTIKNEKALVDKVVQQKERIYIDTLSFIEYNDDGDYYILDAKNNKMTYSFINDKIEDRSFLRGDIIVVNWKKDTIYIAGDGETPMIAEWIIASRKIKEGPVSTFRKTYKKELKYNYSKENNYSQSYLDKLYLIVEYYLVNSNNEQIKYCIARNEQLEYSIEEQTNDGKEYTVLGICFIFEHRVNTIKWLYYEHGDTNKLFEYDLPNEKLIEFK